MSNLYQKFQDGSATVDELRALIDEQRKQIEQLHDLPPVAVTNKQVYRAAMNFIANEMGISRDQIREWVWEFSAKAIQAQIDRINPERWAKEMIKDRMTDYLRSEAKVAASDYIRDNLVITVSTRKDGKETSQ